MTLTASTKFDSLSAPVTQQELTEYREADRRNTGSNWIAVIIVLIFLSAIFFMGFIVSISME